MMPWWGWLLAALAAGVAAFLTGAVVLMRRGVGHQVTLVVPHPADPDLPWIVTVRVKFNHPLARVLRRVFGHTHIALGHTIYVNDADIGCFTFAHELAHVWQWEKYGRVEMAVYYLRPYVLQWERYKDHWAERAADAYMRVAATACPSIQQYAGQFVMSYPFHRQRLEWVERAGALL